MDWYIGIDGGGKKPPQLKRYLSQAKLSTRRRF